MNDRTPPYPDLFAAVEAPARAPLVWIKAPHFCASVVPGEFAAPIIRYMTCWSVRAICNYCAIKGWRCEVLD
jgi:hypothetical protein